MAAEAEAEAEARQEVEAVAAVYGDDCRVVCSFPPHVVVHVRPRTADDSSRQFVELFLGIKASSQYPKEPPHVYTVESKGLDENRQTYLISSIQNKAKELSFYSMLLILCEEAREILSNMNHPAGDCPLCLYPLLQEDKDGSALPFMKLMSCYHYFHSECIMRWWEWLQHDDTDSKKSCTAVTTGDHREGKKKTPTHTRNSGHECSGGPAITGDPAPARSSVWYPVIHASEGLDLSSSANCHNISQHKGFCPVCRKVFDEKDIEHVCDLLGANTSKLASLTIDLDEDENEVLHSESENNRREKFASLFNLQQERNGLIEPKKDLSIQPGMYISRPPSAPTAAEGDTIDDSCEGTTTSTSAVEPHSQTNSTGTTTKHNSGHRRRNRSHASRRQPFGQPGGQQWRRKGADISDL